MKQHEAQGTTKDQHSNEGVLMPFLKLMGVGFVVMVVIIALINYSASKEYPQLRFEESLNDVVDEVNTGRGYSYVTFRTRNVGIGWGQNFNYQDFPTISSVIGSGDLITKKAYSDTIIIKHSGKEYLYVIGKVIRPED